MKIVIVLLIICSAGYAEEIRTPATSANQWNTVKTDFEKSKSANSTTGWSYVISGGSAVLAGFLGQTSSSDQIDKAIYSAFQIIGAAAIGIGLYKMNVDNDDYNFYKTLNDSLDLKPEQKMELFQSYHVKKLESEKQERIVRAVAHGAAALVSLYGASVQPSGTVQSALYFVSAANLLASLSYTFNF